MEKLISKHLGNLGKKEREKFSKRVGYIEGREDLFETQLLKIEKKSSEDQKNILVLSRDPGAGNSIWPVLKELEKEKNISLEILTDGRAKEIFMDKFETQDATPPDLRLGMDKSITKPDLILAAPSTSEHGLEKYMAATFPEVPMVLVVDHYMSSQTFLNGLRGAEEDHKSPLPFPQKVCVLDKEAKEILLKDFSELQGRIEVTGQPAFDKFAEEDTEGITEKTKEQLGISPEMKLISFMATVNMTEDLARKMAEELQKVEGNFVLAFRKHPKYKEFHTQCEDILKEAGIEVIDSDKLPTNDVGAASDIVMTTTSTEGMHGIMRRKPTIHITDESLLAKTKEAILISPLPPVKLGASIGVENISELSSNVEKLIDSKSQLNKKLLSRMERHYPNDGKNTERVVEIIKKLLKK